jgi:hypothetical protein
MLYFDNAGDSSRAVANAADRIQRRCRGEFRDRPPARRGLNPGPGVGRPADG